MRGKKPSGHVEHVMVEIGKDGSERIHVYGPGMGTEDDAPEVKSALGQGSPASFVEEDADRAAKAEGYGDLQSKRAALSEMAKKKDQ